MFVLCRNKNKKVIRFTSSGIRPYECDICGQTFNQQGPLSTHRRIHTGEKPFVSNICDERFMRKDSMLFHKRKHYLLQSDIDNL